MNGQSLEHPGLERNLEEIQSLFEAYRLEVGIDVDQECENLAQQNQQLCKTIVLPFSLNSLNSVFICCVTSYLQICVFLPLILLEYIQVAL